MDQKFKDLKILKNAFVKMGYFIGNPKSNGEFFLINKVVKHYDIFFDIGFYKGEISYYLRKKNNKIIIYAFDLIDLTQNKKNKISKVNFFNYGLSNKNKYEKKIFFYPTRKELTSLKRRTDYNPKITKNYRIISKKIIKLDKFFKEEKINLKKRIFIKIDTDGNESDILVGARKILTSKKVSGYFEYSSGWKNHKKKLNDLFYFLKNLNYDIYRMTKNGLILMRYFSALDENYFQSHFFFTKTKLKKLGFKKRKIISLTSDKKEDFFV